MSWYSDMQELFPVAVRKEFEFLCSEHGFECSEDDGGKYTLPAVFYNNRKIHVSFVFCIDHRSRKFEEGISDSSAFDILPRGEVRNMMLQGMMFPSYSIDELAKLEGYCPERTDRISSNSDIEGLVRYKAMLLRANGGRLFQGDLSVFQDLADHTSTKHDQ